MDFLLTDASHMICHRAQSKCWTLLPIGWRLLLEAKKISRHLSLVLTVAGMVMLSLIALWKPWIDQVRLIFKLGIKRYFGRQLSYFCSIFIYLVCI